MQTKLTAEFSKTHDAREAEAILRSCVHCGFCNATCPTYQLLGDERDGPRGRIYLIKQVLEGSSPSQETQLRLDRCLTCQACETTCPSGVQFGRLVNIGRDVIDKQVPRSWHTSVVRRLLLSTVPYPNRIATLVKAGQLLRPILPRSIKQLIPNTRHAASVTKPAYPRQMLVLEGCIQSVTSPATNQALATVLDKIGISLISASQAGCCGAMSHHLSATEQAHDFIKTNIDAWWPYVEKGVEAVIVSASGCGNVVKDYGYQMREEPDYAEKAATIAKLVKDPVEILGHELAEQDWSSLGQQQLIAFHSPCTLQHGQKLAGQVESLLERLGFRLMPVKDNHLCCGSAGTYSILQPALSNQLREHKLHNLHAGKPDRIVTANIGCELYLTTPDYPLNHWIELIAENLHHV